jgi:hypothetical protein
MADNSKSSNSNYKLCYLDTNFASRKNNLVALVYWKNKDRLQILKEGNWTIRDATTSEIIRWFETQSSFLGDIADEFNPKMEISEIMSRITNERSRLKASDADQAQKTDDTSTVEEPTEKSTSYTTYEKEAVEDL